MQSGRIKYLAHNSRTRAERLGNALIARLRLSGVVMATLAFCLALTPSLIPRGPLYMGALAGVSAALGYGLGLMIAWLITRIGRWRLRARHRLTLWRIVALLAPMLAFIMVIIGNRWQNEVRALVGMPPLAGYHFLVIFGIATVAGAVCVGLARLICWTYGEFFEHLVDRVPRVISVLLATIGVGVLLVLIVQGVMLQTFIQLANASYQHRNQGTPQGAKRPTIVERSGSVSSLVSWQSLGYMGRGFIGRGVLRADIESWSGQAAAEPIRVYVGLDSAATPAARARLALAELQRTGAFERKYLVLITPTGTGWIEPGAANALSYIANGDVAMAAVQYSYLPSWISVLVDKNNASEAGRALNDTVYEYWKTLPANRRPQLLVYGLSLGSFGSQSAYSGLSDLQARTEGALFVGTPHDSQPWREFTERRDMSSREILPVYQGGRQVRFAATNQQISESGADWQTERILYLQHASDPIVWWNPDVIFSRPDWLVEPRGADVSPAVRWIPVVTFLQLTVDQVFAGTVPNGHGHNYANTMVAAWEALLKNTAWSTTQLEQLQQKIAAMPFND